MHSPAPSFRCKSHSDALVAFIFVFVVSTSISFGQVTDHRGQDWIPGNQSEIFGIHLNVRTFLIPAGSIVHIKAREGGTDGSFGFVEIRATSIQIDGVLNGRGRGFAGGGGGGGAGGADSSNPGAFGAAGAPRGEPGTSGGEPRGGDGGIGGRGFGEQGGTEGAGGRGANRSGQDNSGLDGFDGKSATGVEIGSGGGGGGGGGGGHSYDCNSGGGGGGGGGAGGRGGALVRLIATEQLLISGEIITSGTFGGDGANGEEGFPYTTTNDGRGGRGRSGGSGLSSSGGFGGAGGRGAVDEAGGRAGRSSGRGGRGGFGGGGAGGGVWLECPGPVRVTGPAINALGATSEIENNSGLIQILHGEGLLTLANTAPGSRLSLSTIARRRLPSPIVTPSGATGFAPVTVSMASEEGSIIRYTADGSDPTPSSQVYTAPFVLARTTEVRAKAFGEHADPSDSTIAKFIFVLKAPVLSVDRSPESTDGYYLKAPVMLSAEDANGDSAAELRYTTDGSDPTNDSSVFPGAIPLSVNSLVQVKAFRDGWTASEKTSASVKFRAQEPTFNRDDMLSEPAPFDVHISSPTAGSIRIHYVLGSHDGELSPPTETDPAITNGGAVRIASTSRIVARAYHPGWDPSPPASRMFFIDPSRPSELQISLNARTITLTWHPPSGSFLEAVGTLTLPEWRTIATESPFTEQLGTFNRFYRLRTPDTTPPLIILEEPVDAVLLP